MRDDLRFCLASTLSTVHGDACNVVFLWVMMAEMAEIITTLWFYNITVLTLKMNSA